ncbi:MAG TPA: oligopeptide transporter, OPT family [Bryobacteraceae bacterium]|jgi:putative OPT family oligopeptide transporter|nr:oligopeptide transporter, OPT family [Bryobacteraceae bacterium]
MSSLNVPPAKPHVHQPFVPPGVEMKEFTLRAVVLGLVMCVVLGAANAYLGLRAGQTIAATYPAAVIGMAVLRIFKGSILEENIARTAGSIGESVAAGAVFTIPAFLISHSWMDFSPGTAYWKSTSLMLVGSVLGVLFVSLVRRAMVEDPTLPFPESVAASQIHKAGQLGAQAAKYLFYNMAFAASVFLAGFFNLFATDKDWLFPVGTLGKSSLRLGPVGTTNAVATGGVTVFSGPTVSPAYVGVGYVIGPMLASLNFSGTVIAWGLLIPLLIYFMGPQLQAFMPPNAGDQSWIDMANTIWRYIVRPVAVGGMLFGAAYTLFRMRKSLGAGLVRAFAELKAGAPPPDKTERTERYMSSRVVLMGIFGVFAVMIVLYRYLSGGMLPAMVAAIVMLIVGFCFATVSGYLVGVIGSSNNPISGLTLSTVIIAALLMVALGVQGTGGVVAVLGVAAVVCVSSAVSGELLQDFKVGYILGGTPRSIQIVELIAVVLASAVMYFPLLVLYQGNINAGGSGFGDKALPAPQAGLMASLAQGIVGGDMAWPLIAAGILMGLALVMIGVKSPMLVAIGMYLPIGTTFAIFIGGMVRWATDTIATRRGLNEAQRTRVESAGVLAASGMIAGEALTGLVTATFSFLKWKVPVIFANPSYIVGVAVLILLGIVLIQVPLSNAGRPEDPAPPAAFV